MKFLSEAEREYVLLWLKEGGALDRREEADDFSWGEVWKAFTLPHVWILAVVLFMSGEYHGSKRWNGTDLTLERHGSIWARLVRVKSISSGKRAHLLDDSFTPSIVQGLGYSPTRTQLMTVPPFATAFVCELQLNTDCEPP